MRFFTAFAEFDWKRTMALALAAALLLGVVQVPPALARSSLGIFEDWGAFRDPRLPRCYAISKGERTRGARDFEPYATIGTWPNRKIRNQIHLRLSRRLAANGRVSLAIGGDTYRLTAGEADAWAVDKRMDAAIVAAMRAGSRMRVSATDRGGNRFTDQYSLSGVATAIDAATIACARD
ncbi:invasion associated locus B family protein [Citromicrobium bathyomarinum]|uniref:invasion associated locus B family protein n=1 Tax=Citromicrobium bathyomarinum TaxID=72174 RepID=UPI00315ACB02